MDELISRQAAIDALKVAYFDEKIQSGKDDPCVIDAMTDWSIRQIKALPSAQPDLDEFCFTCKEYDQEKHCCPRWNRVIRKTAEEVRKNAEAEQMWIPMSERTPDDGQLVLVQFIGFANVNNLDRFGVIKFSLAGVKAHIVAWMPLQPYERSEE